MQIKEEQEPVDRNMIVKTERIMGQWSISKYQIPKLDKPTKVYKGC